MVVDHFNSPQVKSLRQHRLELSRQVLLARRILPFLPVWDVCPLSYLWQWVRKRSRHGAGAGGLCESAPGPRPLLYAGTRSEGITDTETKSLSSQPPQNRNTPIIKERENQRGRESGCRQRARGIQSERRDTLKSNIHIFGLGWVCNNLIKMCFGILLYRV